MMTPYYAKQVIEFNENSMKYIPLQSDWILGFNDMEQLGNAVRKKLDERLDELKKQNIELEKIINNKNK